MDEIAVKTLKVIGAGTMGGGIAAICLAHGLEVTLYDPFEDVLERARQRIAKRVSTPELEAKLETTTLLEQAARDADFVIEAVPEVLDLKRSIFEELDGLVPDHSVLATNTSQLSVTAIAAATKRPENVIGMHWFNPPERMKLIEIVRAVQTSDYTLALTEAVSHRCEKETIVVRDSQGFVSTRALAALLCEGMRMLEEGVATAEDVDKALKLGLNHPMGPLELADYIGLDTVLYIAESMSEAMGERFRAPQTLRKLVEAGRLGRKTGQGFYTYDKR